MTPLFVLVATLPEKIHRKIYSYLFDLSEIKYIKNKYTHNNTNQDNANFNDTFKHYFSDLSFVWDYHYWQRYFIEFPNFVSCVRFHKKCQLKNTAIFDYIIKTDTFEVSSQGFIEDDNAFEFSSEADAIEYSCEADPIDFLFENDAYESSSKDDAVEFSSEADPFEFPFETNVFDLPFENYYQC